MGGRRQVNGFSRAGNLSVTSLAEWACSCPRRASDPPGKGRPGPGLSQISKVYQILNRAPSRLAVFGSALAEPPIGRADGSSA